MAPFVIEKKLRAPIELVWRVITNKDDMKNWYFSLADFKPAVGFQFEFMGGKDGREYRHLCEVTEVIPKKKLTYSWRYDGYDGISFVTFELQSEDDQTTSLKLTHRGLETFPQNNPDFDRKNFEAGWTSLIGKNLTGYVEQINR